MLQYLLDDYLPGYKLPIRRLTSGRWNFVADHKVDGLPILSYSERDDIIAMKWINNYQAYILCDDLSQYYVVIRGYVNDDGWFGCERVFLVYTHLLEKFDVKVYLDYSI